MARTAFGQLLLLLAAIALPVAILPAAPPVAEAPSELWQLDQLRIAAGVDPKVLKALEPAHSLADVIDLLRARNVPFTHANTTLRPDRLPADVRAEIAKLPPGEPFVFPMGSEIWISVIVARSLPPAPILPPPPPHGA